MAQSFHSDTRPPSRGLHRWLRSRAAALKSGETPIRTHWGKADQAKNLHKNHGLPNITDLLQDLNVMRKAMAYGDEEFDESEYDAEDIARQVEDYYDKVSAFVKR